MDAIIHYRKFKRTSWTSPVATTWFRETIDSLLLIFGRALCVKRAGRKALEKKKTKDSGGNRSGSCSIHVPSGSCNLTALLPLLPRLPRKAILSFPNEASVFLNRIVIIGLASRNQCHFSSSTWDKRRWMNLFFVRSAVASRKSKSKIDWW